MLFKSMFWLSMSMATLAMALPDLAARDATVCGKVEIRARPGTEFAVRRVSGADARAPLFLLDITSRIVADPAGE